MSVTARVRCEDWRAAAEADLAPLYRAECRRWHDTIGWDFEPSCATIESARKDGRLPGVLARRWNGRIAGWSFFLLHDERLQIGGLVGEDESSRRALLRASMESRQAASARGISCFVYPQSAALRCTLEQARFVVERHRYMALDLAEVAGWSRVLPWPADLSIGALSASAGEDSSDLIRLIARSYAGKREAACFAPDQRLDQWAHYVGGLVHGQACGRYLPDASFALRDSHGELAAAVLTTRIGTDTAHLAQIVVDPRRRGQALGRGLVRAAGDALVRLHYRCLTLLVAESNDAACRLYGRCGFRDVTAFLHGTRAAA